MIQSFLIGIVTMGCIRLLNVPDKWDWALFFVIIGGFILYGVQL